MNALPNQKIIEFLADIESVSPVHYQVALKTRDFFLNFGPDLSEEIKYGGLVYLRGKDLLGGIFFYEKHISIEFSYGVSLSDPYSMLEGKGKYRRHIKLRSMDDIEAKNLPSYIKEAVTN